MAQLAIKGHPTRGKEIIEILEMLGGINKYNLRGDTDEWFILNGTQIQRSYWLLEKRGLTLEEFLEIFPYKVGDKVRVWSQDDDEFFYGSYSCESKTIKSMQWNEIRGKVAYTIEGIDRVFYKEELIPYKEVNMKENKVDLPLKGELYDDNRITYLIPDGYEVSKIENSEIILQKKKSQYPTTYAESCSILGFNKNYDLNNITTHDVVYDYKLQMLYRLLICRDAYWKIAGEQMGLDEPWNPDWKDDSDKYFICYLKDELWMSNIRECNRFLVFPTKEMRDEFYNNFKDFINEVKELL
jgi:hypothetical protein